MTTINSSSIQKRRPVQNYHNHIAKTSLIASLLGFLLLPFIGYGQALDEPQLYRLTQVSPNAAALGKYGEFPVGLATGIPSINIPFYEVSVNRMKVPVGISYSAGGIRVEEIASSVGLGWALNAGGAITRSVKGAPDDLELPAFGTYAATAYTVDSLVKMNYNTSLDWETTVKPILKKAVVSKIDTEPDIFYYNFAGHSGKFVYNQNDGKYYTIPYSKLIIAVNSHFTEFTITDENGINYVFGQLEESTRGANTVKTGWFLTSMTDPTTNKTIGFGYSSKTVNYETMGSEQHYFSESVSVLTPNDKQPNTSHVLTKLNNIYFEGGRVNFTYGHARTDLPGDSAITEIRVFDVNNELIRDFDLGYGYFYGTGGDWQSGRIGLSAKIAERERVQY